MSALRLNPLLKMLAVLIWCTCALAAPPLTLVSDMLYKADGTPFTGTVTISWKSFTAADSSNIPANSLTLTIVGGVLRVKLVPTANAVTQAYYYARFNTDGHTQFTELWSIPAATTALAVKDIRVESASTSSSGSTTPPSSVTMADISGLTEALADRPTKSVTYLAGRAAMIDANGEIASVSGTSSDCVRVDGTSGACGSGTASIGFVDHEVPTGTVDGANAVFTLNGIPSPTSSLHLYRNGLLLRAAVDFVLSGNTLTFVNGAAPQTSDLIEVTYRTGGQ